MTVLELLKKVWQGELTELDNRIVIKELTEGFKVELLKKIEAEAIIYELRLAEECQRLIDGLNDQEEEEYLNQLIESDRDSDLGLDSKAGCFIYSKGKKYNLVALVYPQQYMRLSMFQFYIRKQLIKSENRARESKKQIEPKEQNSNIKPIKWLKSNESLRLLIEELISNDLIEKRRVEDIINEHFKIDDNNPNTKPEPIIWKSKKVLLAHLLAGLDSNIRVDRKWKDLEPHFYWNGKIAEGLRQSHNSNPYPNDIEIIQGILSKIKGNK